MKSKTLVIVGILGIAALSLLTHLVLNNFRQGPSASSQSTQPAANEKDPSSASESEYQIAPEQKLKEQALASQIPTLTLESEQESPSSDRTESAGEVEPATESGHIAGRVVDSRGQPVENCEAIFLTGGADRSAINAFAERGRYRAGEPYAVTDASGEFLSESLTPGTYIIAWRAPGYIYRAYDDPVEVRADETTSGIHQVLPRAGILFGEVVENLTGKPIENAKVSAGVVSSNLHSGALLTVHKKVSTFSDSSGRFENKFLLPGESYELTAEHPRYLSVTTKVVPVDSGQPVRIVMTPGAQIEGQVVTEVDRKPVPNAQVFAFLEDKKEKEVRSATEGYFLIEGLQNEAYCFSARFGDLLTQDLPEYRRKIARTGKNAPLELRLVPGGTVELTVLEEQSERSIPGAEVTFDKVIRGRYTTTETHSKETTDAQGKAYLSGLDSMKLRYSVRASGYAPILINWKDLLVTAPGRAVSRTVHLAPGQIITGTVVDESDHPVEGVHVSVYKTYDQEKEFVSGVGHWGSTGPDGGMIPTGIPQTIAESVTPPDGRFQLENLPLGYVDLDARHEQYTLGKATLISTNEKDVKIILHKGALISGRVVDDQGLPVAAANVELSWKYKTGGQQRPAVTSAQSDENGHWTIDRLDEGEYGVTARKDGRRSQLLSGLKLGWKDRLEGLELVLPAKGFTASGRVVDRRSGEPVAGARLTLVLQKEGLVDFPGHSTTDDEGTFRFANVAPGNYMIFASQAPAPYVAPSYMKNFRFVVKDRDIEGIELRFARGATIRGRVLLPSGEGAAQAQVAFFNRTMYEWNTQSLRGLRAGSDGSFEIAGLPPGPNYRFTATLPGYGQASIDKEKIEEGQVIEDLELRLCGAGNFSGYLTTKDGGPVTEGYFVVTRSLGDTSLNKPLGQGNPDSEGFYRIDDLPEGDLAAELHASNDISHGRQAYTAIQSRSVTVVSGQETTDINFVVSPKTFSGYIAGKVVNSEGQGVGEVKVSAYYLGVGPGAREEGNRGEATSDSNGLFRIDNLKEGQFILSAIPQESIRSEYAFNVRIKGDSPCDDLEIVMKRYGVVKGQVVQKGSGEAVKEFRAGIVALGVSRYTPVWFKDTDGRFRIDRVQPDSITLKVEVENIGTVEKLLTVGDGEVLKDLLIEVGGDAGIEGRIVAQSDGSPIAGASVVPASLNPTEYTSKGTGIGHQAEAMTDADGNFRVTDISVGLETLYIRHPDYGLAFATGIEVRAGQIAEAGVIRLSEPGRIEGHVYNEKGKPWEQAQIMIWSPERFRYVAFTDSEGYYQSGPLLPDAYRVQLYSAGMGSKFSVAIKWAELEAGETEVVNFGAPGAIVRGVVTRQGLPVESCLLYLIANTLGLSGSSMQAQSSDNNGEYRFEGVEAGAYILALFGQGSKGLLATRPLDVQAQEEIQIDFSYPEGAVSGKVMDGATGQPLKQAKLFLQGEPTGNAYMDRLMEQGCLTFITGSNGLYRFENLPSGSYRLHATKEDYASQSISLELGQDESRSDVDFTLYGGGSLRCWLKDALSGETLKGQVAFFDLDSNPIYPARSEGDAPIECQGLPPGRVVVVPAPRDVGATIYGPSMYEIEIQAGENPERELLCPVGCLLKLEILDTQGQAIIHPEIQFIDSSGLDRRGPRFQDFFRSANQFALEPGTYRLNVQANGYRPYSATVEILPGEYRKTETMTLLRDL